jgi:hypothetical protein
MRTMIHQRHTSLCPFHAAFWQVKQQKRCALHPVQTSLATLPQNDHPFSLLLHTLRNKMFQESLSRGLELSAVLAF